MTCAARHPTPLCGAVPPSLGRGLVLAGLSLLIAGCSGLDGSSSFSCAAPPGVTCTSTSGIYANAAANNLPGSRRVGDEGRPGESAAPRGDAGTGVTAGHRPQVAYDTPINTLEAPSPAAPLSPRAFNAPNSGMPIRTPERIMRVWFAPTTDEEDAVHDQRFVYVAVAPGSWTLESTRANVRAQFKALHPLSVKNPANKQSAPGASGTQGSTTAQNLPAQAAAPRDPQPFSMSPGNGASPGSGYSGGGYANGPLPRSPVFPTTPVAPSWDLN